MSIEHYTPAPAPSTTISLQDQMSWVQATAGSSILPKAYRDDIGSALVAVGLGASMGLSPAESLYRIDVIQGKPCASAELIASNVRAAGHKLRIEQDRENVSVTATIVRVDDPDHPISEVRDMKWAQQMGLTGKDQYRKQPMTMLTWRAITAVARIAAPETLYGVKYTPDEMYDSVPDDTRHQYGQRQQERVVEIKETGPAQVTDEQLATLVSLFKKINFTDPADMLDFVQTWAADQGIERQIRNARGLTEDEARHLIAHLHDAAEDYAKRNVQATADTDEQILDLGVDEETGTE